MQQLAVNTSRDRQKAGAQLASVNQSLTRGHCSPYASHWLQIPSPEQHPLCCDRPCTRDLSQTAFETKNSRVRAQCQEQFNCASLRPNFSESSVRLQYYGLQLDITFCGCFLPRLAFSHTLISVELEVLVEDEKLTDNM